MKWSQVLYFMVLPSRSLICSASSIPILNPCNIFFSSVLNCLLLTYCFYLFAEVIILFIHSFPKFHEHLYDQYFEQFIMYIAYFHFIYLFCCGFCLILLIGTYSSVSSVCLSLCMFLCIRYVSCVSQFWRTVFISRMSCRAQKCPQSQEIKGSPLWSVCALLEWLGYSYCRVMVGGDGLRVVLRPSGSCLSAPVAIRQV